VSPCVLHSNIPTHAHTISANMLPSDCHSTRRPSFRFTMSHAGKISTTMPQTRLPLDTHTAMLLCPYNYAPTIGSKRAVLRSQKQNRCRPHTNHGGSIMKGVVGAVNKLHPPPFLHQRVVPKQNK
jgi:hypothetical protein